MTNMTLAIPDDIYKQMKEFPYVRWSEVARSAIVERLETLRRVEEIASKSKLTKEDAQELGKKIKKAMTKRYLNETGT